MVYTFLNTDLKRYFKLKRYLKLLVRTLTLRQCFAQHAGGGGGGGGREEGREGGRGKGLRLSVDRRLSKGRRYVLCLHQHILFIFVGFCCFLSFFLIFFFWGGGGRHGSDLDLN